MDSTNENGGGGGFVLGAPTATFTPEGFSEQQRLMVQTAEGFAQDVVAPASEIIERQDLGELRRLMRQAGELGLTAVDIPEAYGGLGLDLVASAIVADHLAVQGSFSVTFGAHAGIATLPLVYFGSDEQKRRYLPKLATAEWIGAYALSEAGAGSDALALRAEARLAPDGKHYLLSGEKMWISNAGIADLFTVFARTGDTISAFLVEAGFPGVATGAEEHKMGIQGSSTRPLLLREARVPVENVLGGVGEGGHIAFQILNAGRFKLGAACIGGARNTIREGVRYAAERHAFGKPIAQMGLVQQMIADMVLALYASESAVYRTAGLMAAHSGLDEFAAECSIVKIDASEMLDGVVDRAVQIHGGNGFVRGNRAEQAYRDSRVNRIFEGTNEINRLLLSGMLLRRAQKGRLGLMAAVQVAMAELMSGSAASEPQEQARKAALLIMGLAWQKFGEGLAQEEEALAAIADLLIGVYRLQSVAARGLSTAGPGSAAATVIASEGLDAIEVQARRALAMLSEGDGLRTQLAWLRRLLKREAVNVIALRRALAEQAIERGGYPF